MPRVLDLEEKVRKLRKFYQRERRVPGYEEMLKLFEYKSKNAVFGLLGKLEDEGYVRKGRNGKISLTSQLTGSIRLLGTVQAGFPSPAEEELVDLLSLDEYLVERPEATFMLTVEGESMIDAGIHHGDIVIVEKGKVPKSGDVVVAQVDGEWTIKYFIKDRRVIRLEPANRRFKTIRPTESLEIGGTVKAVIRKYR